MALSFEYVLVTKTGYVYTGRTGSGFASKFLNDAFAYTAEGAARKLTTGYPFQHYKALRIDDIPTLWNTNQTYEIDAKKLELLF